MPDGHMSSDEYLAESASKGNMRAFEELYNRYKNRVFNFIYRMLGNKETAEEVAQEVFIKMYKNLRIYDPSKKFIVWIYTIARNLAKNAIRDRKYFKDMSLDQVIFNEDEEVRLKDLIESDSSLRPDAIAEDAELQDEAQKVLDSLPEEYKEVITLCCVQGLNYEHAAGILGISVASVGVRLNKAKLLFMKKLGISENRG